MSSKFSKFPKFPKFSYSWFSIPFLLLAWMAIASQFPPYILPQVWDVVGEAQHWLAKGTLLPHLWASLLEIVGGFGSAIIVAISLGFLCGFFRPLREFITPLNGLFMSIPPVAWAPLMMIIFGIGYTTIAVVIFIAAVNPMIITITEGILQIQGAEVRAARSLGARRWQLFMYIYLPASLPFVTAGLRIGFSQAWRSLVAAEMVGATQGIGWMVSMGGEIGNAKQVLLGIVMIGGMSWLIERLIFRQMEKRYEVWRLA